jgi:hypothetical protein
VLADGLVRYRGEAVLALVGERAAVMAVRDAEIPIEWQPEPPLYGIDAATAPVPRWCRPTNRAISCSRVA